VFVTTTPLKFVGAAGVAIAVVQKTPSKMMLDARNRKEQKVMEWAKWDNKTSRNVECPSIPAYTISRSGGY
jgi:hypothetical protein